MTIAAKLSSEVFNHGAFAYDRKMNLRGTPPGRQSVRIFKATDVTRRYYRVLKSTEFWTKNMYLQKRQKKAIQTQQSRTEGPMYVPGGFGGDRDNDEGRGRGRGSGRGRGKSRGKGKGKGRDRTEISRKKQRSLRCQDKEPHTVVILTPATTATKRQSSAALSLRVRQKRAPTAPPSEISHLPRTAQPTTARTNYRRYGYFKDDTLYRYF